MRLVFICSMLIAVNLAANPFQINFGPKENVTNEDYINIQKQLAKLAKSKFLDELIRPEDSVFLLRAILIRAALSGSGKQSSLL